MKKTIGIMLLAAAVSLFLFTACGKSAADNGDQQDAEEEKAAVTAMAEEFGSRLKNVSLLAPAEDLKESMEDSYGDLVAPDLIEAWLKDPENAPGRLVSSPWPDRIEVQSAEALQDGSYEVEGKIIEITSTEEESGGIAAQRPVTLHLIPGEVPGDWLIDEVAMGPYDTAAGQTGGVLYDNKDYGFRVRLPLSWKGYTVLTGQWEGMSIPDRQDEKLAATGPSITIRHPLWTQKDPRQDIPIYIFTPSQWEAMGKEQFHIGAAPMGPTELTSNRDYIFALPARYNYSFPKGYEEVDELLLRDNALEAY